MAGFLKVEKIEEYDVSTQTLKESSCVKWDSASIQNNLIKDIGAVETAVLLAIASFCNADGEAFPSQRKLAEITGLSLPTVNKAVKKLLNTKINGVPVIARELESLGSRKRFSVYSLATTEEEQKKKRNAKDFVIKFKNMFEEKYNFPYLVNYGRDTSLIKNKLMAECTEEEIDQIFEYVFSHYTKKWSKPAYPYPTITMICTWLGNVALQNMKEEQKKNAEYEEIKAVTEENEDTGFDVFNNL